MLRSRVDSLRGRVRERTADAHRALERTPLMQAFAGRRLSTARYGRYLAVQLGLHAPLESALVRWLPSDWAELRLCKSGWLRQDLQALGASVDQRPGPEIRIDSRAQAMGVLYVLEGSTLGLQVVRRTLGETHPGRRHAGRFLLGYGPDTGRHWLGFLAQFEALHEDQWPEAIDAAQAVFGSFLTGFTDAECHA